MKKVMSGFLVLLLLLTITVSPMSPVFCRNREHIKRHDILC